MTHGTPKFRKAFAKVQAVIKEDGDVSQRARLLFRDEMLKLGHEERVRNLYRIQGKLSKQAAFFKPNGPQDDYLTNRKGRDIILKIRQVGFTTLAGVRGLDYALWEPNMRAGIMAHLNTIVTTIFKDIVKFSYNWFKKDWGHLYSPVEDADSGTTLSFKQDGLGRELNSSIRVLFDFRGKTIHFLHVSEASRIEGDRLTGSLQGVPANGEVIFESTPQGRGGEYYRQWNNFKSMGSLAPYKGHFIPWFAFYPEVPEDWKLPEGTQLTPYESSLIETYDGLVTESHVAWRRWCIEANCEGDADKFENEYPSNDVDCFFTGESLVFGSGILKNQERNTRPPAQSGFLVSTSPGRVTLHEDPKGTIHVWEKPDFASSYAIGADASGGVGRDAGAAYVIDRRNGKMVAAIHGQYEPSDFALELEKLAIWYNRAFINPEVNNHGHVVVHVLTTRGYRNIYHRRDFDSISKKVVQKAGWLTTNESKLILTENFKNAAKEGKVTILDKDLINEMSTFVQVSSKMHRSIKREAASGCHDDRVMAAALAWEMHSSRGMSDAHEEVDSADESQQTYDNETGLAV